MITLHTNECCKNCLEAVETAEGIINLVDGFCEACYDKQEMGRVRAEDIKNQWWE